MDDSLPKKSHDILDDFTCFFLIVRLQNLYKIHSILEEVLFHEFLLDEIEFFI